MSLLDERQGHRGECADKPFEHLWENPWSNAIELYGCLKVKEEFHCVDGKVRNEEIVAANVDRGRDNRTAAEACCICGGGVPVSDLNLLRSWTLAIYGHDNFADEEEADNTTSSSAAIVY